MNLLFTGQTAIVNEWVAACTQHVCYVYSRVEKKSLHKNAQRVLSLDELPTIDLIFDFHVRVSKKRRIILRDLISESDPMTPIVTNTVTVTATELAMWLDARDRMIGIAALPSLLQAGLLEISFPHSGKQHGRPKLEQLVEDLGKRCEVIDDEVGMIFPRIIALLINEAVLSVQQGVATVDDIDTAMQLGVNYPEGPLAWGAKLGWSNVLSILQALHAKLGDDRYRPASLLKKFALTQS